MVSYHHLQYQKKNNDPILRKPSDRRKDKRTDGQTDESDFIGRCRTNVELPISIWTKWERNNFRDQHQHHCSGAERLGAVIGREASEKITLVRELILGTSNSKSFLYYWVASSARIFSLHQLIQAQIPFILRTTSNLEHYNDNNQ